MSVLHRKLLREAWAMRGQVLAIAVVLAGGVATLIMALTSLDALRDTQQGFYRDYRFADVFVSVSRAPEAMAERVSALPGVQHAETRVVAGAHLEVEGFTDPITGHLVSLPDGRNAGLNAVHLRRGRLPATGATEEVVLSEAFAGAHDLAPGDSLTGILNGRRHSLQVVGTGLSPEFVYQLRPGAILPDYSRHAVLWMNRQALAAAFDQDGSFNDLVVRVERGAREETVVDALDDLLAGHGSLGAITRADQVSHRHLDLEIEQIGVLARTVPVIFLAVAAFLLNVVISRLIGTQREQIGILKAFGYGNAAVAWHYLQLVMLIALLGYGLGVIAGAWLGSAMAGLYADFFRFPYLAYSLTTRSLVLTGLVTVATAATGTLLAVRRAARLPPAEAMRPEPPPVFRTTLLERTGLLRWLGQPTRMMLRSLERRPLRAALSVTAIALACAILMTGRFQQNAIDHMVDMQFNLVQREDVMVSFNEPRSGRAVDELLGLPQVYAVEAFRGVAVELRNGHRRYRLGLQGVEPDATLHRLLDTGLRQVALPDDGLLLTEYLAALLDVAPGDPVQVRVLERDRGVLDLPVAGVISEWIGVSAYLRRDALNTALGEGDVISGARLGVLPGGRDALLRELERRPAVLGISERRAAIDSFYENMAGTVLIFSFITTLLAGSIAFGVIYNNARIALAERARELASLRVLGFRRGEVGWILLGEQALLTVLALPPGFVLGYLLYAAIAGASDSDLYRVPVVPSVQALAFPVAIIAIASLLSAWVIHRRLARLDLVAVLKTRE